ncbi:hypothetical protein [Micromonospora sp. NPDC047730]|uniref:hypothetical protein n=1 Tax=Micromonospora sp. NPDC047730 TaxID=3364253 RepID=UPI00371E8CB7
MKSITRTMAFTGSVLDIGAGMWFAVMAKDVLVDGAELTTGHLMVTVGVATLAVIGGALLVGAIIITAIESAVERSCFDYADGVLHGVHEAIEAGLGQLLHALPPPRDNVRPLRPHPSGHRFRP